jgi:hypothetical protein
MVRGARCSALSVGRRMPTLTQRSPPVHFGARRVCWGDSPPRHSINFVGAREQHRRDFDAERFGSLAVNHQLEFRRLLYRKFVRLCAANCHRARHRRRHRRHPRQVSSRVEPRSHLLARVSEDRRRRTRAPSAASTGPTVGQARAAPSAPRARGGVRPGGQGHRQPRDATPAAPQPAAGDGEQRYKIGNDLELT